MNRKLTLFSVSLFVITLIMITLLFFQHKLVMEKLLSADPIFYYMFLKTVLFGKVPFSSWYPGTGLSYFPNMLTVFIALLITKWHFYLSVPVIIVIKLTILYVTFIWFMKLFVGYRKGILLATFFFLFLMCLALLDSIELYNPYFIFLEYNNHLSTFPFILIMLGSLYQESKNDFFSWTRLCVILLISLLITVSDSLFIAWALIPLLFTLICLRIYSLIDTKKCFWWFFTLAASIPVSFKLRKLITPHEFSFKPYFSISRIPSNFHHFFHVFKNYSMMLNIWFIVSTTISVGFIILFLLTLISRTFRSRAPLKKGTFLLISYHFFVTFFLIFCGLLIGPVPSNIRYFIILFIMPSLILLIFCFSAPQANNKSYYQSIFSMLNVLLVLGIIFKVFFPWKNPSFTYTPKYYACIYKTLKKYHLHHGISGYWEAKPLMIYSPDKKLTMGAYKNQVRPYHWITSSVWFHDRYGFAINDASDLPLFKKNLFANAGKPQKIVSCGIYNIFIYGKNNLYISFEGKKLEEHKQISLSFDHFFSMVGIKNKNSRSAIENKTKSGFLMYGPYVVLPIGNYELKIAYKASNIKLGDHSWIDVVYDNGNKEIRHIILSGDHDLLKNQTIHFHVDKQAKDYAFEFRVFYGGKGNLTIYNMTLQRLKTNDHT